MATDRQRFLFEDKGIGDILAGTRLAVIVNQREYAWRDEHISDLFDDLQEAQRSDQPEYFLGTIVLTPGERGVMEVIDGQQRLATVTILIAAIRDFFDEAKDDLSARTIESNYLLKVDLRSRETEPQLRLNTADNEFFKKAILAPPGSRDRNAQPTKPSHKKISVAAQQARDRIATLVAGYRDDRRSTLLLDWVEFLKDKVRVVVVTVPDDTNAFTVFETLNDRGLELAQSDLIKNLLLGKAGDRLDEVDQRWNAMVGVLDSVGETKLRLTYLRHFVITKAGPTRERDLFGAVKNAVRSKADALEYADDLAESAPHYVALLNTTHEKWNSYGSRVRRQVETLLTLGVEQIRPLAFAMSRYFSPDEAKLAFPMLVSWSVRFLVVGGRGGLLDREYGLKAHDVAMHKIKKAERLASEMREIIPADALFKAAFAEARISNAAIARYYLRTLEETARGTRDPENVPNKEEEAVNLEHILPQNPGEEWGLDRDTASALYKRLGNMVLLRHDANAKLGNKRFAEKRDSYAKSTNILTAEVGALGDWGPDQIAAHQARLADLAVTAWPSFV